MSNYTDFIQRWGRFKIDMDLIRAAVVDLGRGRTDCKQLLDLLSSVLILEARYDMSADCVEYLGLSHCFDVIATGEPPIEYEVEMATEKSDLREREHISCATCGREFSGVMSFGWCPWCGEAIASIPVSRFKEVIVGFKRVGNREASRKE